jgi:aldose 1-epimerase
MEADRFTPVNKGLIPTGVHQPVAGTPFDFTTPHAIGERVNEKNEQLEYGLGYDHNWVLNSQDGTLAKAGELVEPTSGRVMEIWTTEPGLQFYGGNFLDGSLIGKSGKKYEHRSGLCLETQHYPDSPNQPSFPSTTLEKGKVYTSVTEYRFSTR